MIITDKYYSYDRLKEFIPYLWTDKIVKDNKKVEYYNIPCSFDIETSSFERLGNKQAIMYEWTFNVNGQSFIGRTWKEFDIFIRELAEYFNTNINKRLVVYVHNLPYEFQFFRKRLEWDTVFALDKREPVKCVTTDGIEFRCSLILSGYKLEKLGEQLNKYKAKKLVGNLNYDLIRTPITPLTEDEIQYCINDTLVVTYYIQELIERLGDITKIPITKTGFVRKHCRDMCMYEGSHRNNKDKYFNYRNLINSLKLTPEVYRLLRLAFAGGFTHANVEYVDKTLYNIHSFDLTSDYPYQICAEKFPMSSPKKETIKDMQTLESYLKCDACLFEVTFENINSKVSYENYISKSHCIKVSNEIVNNGRIVSAELLTIVVTELDWKIIKGFYSWDNCVIKKFYHFKKAYLPRDFVLSVLQEYEKKTQYKDVSGLELQYALSKENVNSCYGMMVTDPVRDDIIYSCDEWKDEKADITQRIEKYNNDKKRFTYYPWGVWVTAYARVSLFYAISECKNDYVYSDTDSVKIINMDKHIQFFEKYNKMIEKKLRIAMEIQNIPFSMCVPKTIKGKTKLLGAWEYEGCYTRFKTLGAKRYILEQNGKLKITIAGVNKEKGAKFLTEEFGDKVFENFKMGLYFSPEGTGKLTHTYIDEEQYGIIEDYKGKSYNYHEYSSVHLSGSDYTLSLSQEFIEYLFVFKENRYG